MALALNTPLATRSIAETSGQSQSSPTAAITHNPCLPPPATAATTHTTWGPACHTSTSTSSTPRCSHLYTSPPQLLHTHLPVTLFTLVLNTSVIN
ncbi:hypothetical protein Pcinc_007685 [Petrolisthes cinctipes]|uniref:Uncharacterized protein n=1 Tax=Petrolisthes cinctipes TaxID=88211 RepID=A0AAE1GES6_PETCI|nr:hypothetical protein Pcinc_007685 [Petrolisthes cinctipes]